MRGLFLPRFTQELLVHNPSDKQARVEVRAELPPFLAEREWRVRLNFKETTAAFVLASGADREITVALRPGEEFSREELMQVEGGVAIRVLAFADGVLIGGMTYQLDPDLDRAPSEKEDERPIDPNDPAIDSEIGDAELLKEEEERGFRMS